MLSCYFCSATFETRPIDTGHSNPVKRTAAEAEMAAQTAEGEQWENFQLTVTRSGGRPEILSGNTCPAHALQAGAVKLSVG